MQNRLHYSLHQLNIVFFNLEKERNLKIAYHIYIQLSQTDLGLIGTGITFGHVINQIPVFKP